MRVKDSIAELFAQDHFFYLAMDVKRALGLHDILPNFHILTTSFDPLILILRKQNVSVFCLEEVMGGAVVLPRSAGQLILHKKVKEFIKSKTDKPNILSFKPARAFEEVEGYKYLGNSRNLNEKYEDKISFYHLLSKILPANTIPAIIGVFDILLYEDLKKELGPRLVIQFGKGWAGNTTYFIEDKEEFNKLKLQFPETTVRVSKKIDGITLLNNCCIYRKKTLCSYAAIQVNSIDWLNSNPSATSGREWGGNFISKDKQTEIESVTQIIGKYLSDNGYKGYFGIDFLLEKETNKLYVSELNARFTASSPFYTKLEIGRNIIPLYAYHLSEFLGKEIRDKYEGYELIEGTEVNGDYKTINNDKSGTYTIHPNTKIKYKNDSLDSSILLRNKELVLLKDQKKWKIQTNYPILESPLEFKKEFSIILKTLASY